MTCTEILSHTGRHCDAERFRRQDHKAVHPLRNADPGDRFRAEPVHIPCHKNVGKADQSALDARCRANAQHLCNNASSAMEHLQKIEAVTLDTAVDRPIDQHGGGAL